MRWLPGVASGGKSGGRSAKRRSKQRSAWGTPAALDLVEIVEGAWNGVYGEETPSPEVIDDLLVCSQGTLTGLIAAAHLGLTDWRDLRMQAMSLSEQSGR